MVDAVYVRTAQFTTPTSVNGTTDWTTADLDGVTPKAVIIIANHADTDGTAEDDMVLGIGFADATREFFVGISSQHNVTTTNCNRVRNDTSVIALQVDGSAQVTATFDSFIADGVRLTFSAVDSDAQLYTVIFFAGDDLNARADSVALGNGTSAINVTDVGFEPELIFTSGSGAGAAGIFGEAQIHFGIAVNDGSDTNRCFTYEDFDGTGSAVVASHLATDAAALQLNEQSTIWQALIDDFDSGGFSVTPSAGTDFKTMFYLAVNFGSLSAWGGSFDTPTSMGTDSQTGPGFKPQFVMQFMTDLQAEDSIVVTGDGGSFGISTFDNQGNTFSNAWANEDAQTTTDAQSLADNQAVNFASDDGTQQFAVTAAPTMDANGWTPNFAVTDGAARKWFAVAIEEVAPAGVSLLPRPRGMQHMLVR